MFILGLYLGFCIGCSLVYDLNYNNNLEYAFRFNKITWYVILLRIILSPVLIPLIFITELIEYFNSKGL